MATTLMDQLGAERYDHHLTGEEYALLFAIFLGNSNRWVYNFNLNKSPIISSYTHYRPHDSKGANRYIVLYHLTEPLANVVEIGLIFQHDDMDSFSYSYYISSKNAVSLGRINVYGTLNVYKIPNYVTGKHNKEVLYHMIYNNRDHKINKIFFIKNPII